MSTRNYLLPEAIHDYMLAHSLREPPVLSELRRETASRADGSWQAPPEQGQFLGLLVALTGCRNALEIGSFTGYSTICIAQAMAPGGRVIALDANESAHELARRYWTEAGLDHRIELRSGQASDLLDGLIAEGRTGDFDFAFVDADKPGYAGYYEQCLRLVRPGGLLVFDNVFMGGAVTEGIPARRYAEAMKTFNARLHRDPRITISMLPIGDGITLARIRD